MSEWDATLPVQTDDRVPDDMIVLMPFELYQRGLQWGSLTEEERENLQSDIFQSALRKELWVIKNVRFE